MKLEYEQAQIPGGYYRSNTIDLRSRRLKAVLLPTGWNDARIFFWQLIPNNGSPLVLLDKAGADVALVGAAERLIIVGPDDIECLGEVRIASGTSALVVDQGSPAGFSVTPDTADFTSDNVTFTVTIVDVIDGSFPFDVTLDADYTDAAGLTTELNSQASDITWTNNAGTITASYVGNPGSTITLAAIVDPNDHMGFAALSGATDFPATDTTITLLTEPRT